MSLQGLIPKLFIFLTVLFLKCESMENGILPVIKTGEIKYPYATAFSQAASSLCPV